MIKTRIAKAKKAEAVKVVVHARDKVVHPVEIAGVVKALGVAGVKEIQVDKVRATPAAVKVKVVAVEVQAKILNSFTCCIIKKVDLLIKIDLSIL